jgi:Fic-DOC domain mobile mystery protein B
VSKLEIKYPPGATPLDPDELAGLIPTYITTQGELNTLERENILEAAVWALGKKHPDILNVSFCFDLHKKMFKNVWKWAGTPRTSNKNIGVSRELISQQLKLLFDDTDYWIKHGTYTLDEIGARFHHRLVFTHAFANGNGRHARMMADIVLEQNGGPPFTWGNSDLYDSESAARKEYISSLKLADKGNFDPLLKFVRS